jgi:hypothetical protein
VVGSTLIYSFIATITKVRICCKIKAEFLLHEATKTTILLLGPKNKFRPALMFYTDVKFEFKGKRGL